MLKEQIVILLQKVYFSYIVCACSNFIIYLLIQACISVK